MVLDRVCRPGRNRAIWRVVHGDDFTFCGFDEHLDWIENLMTSWFEVKVRAGSRPDKNRCLGGNHTGLDCPVGGLGINFEADPRHRSKVLNYVGFNDRTSGQLTNSRVLTITRWRLMRSS